MTKTYTHDPETADNNPLPPSFDALSVVGKAITDGALGAGPLVRNAPRFSDAALVEIMGFQLSPSPEMAGAGCAVLDVDYADGETRTFDVTSEGSIVPRRQTYIVQVVAETELQPDQLTARMTDALAFVRGTVATVDRHV